MSDVKRCGLESFRLARMLDAIKKDIDEKKLTKEDFEHKLRLLEDRLIEFGHACKIDVDDILEKSVSALYETKDSFLSMLLIEDIAEQIRRKLTY